MIKKIIAIVLIAIAIIIEVYLQINNIDMTDMRLLISYPLEHLVSVILLFIGGYIGTRD